MKPLLKIAIVGPESTGKSSLSEALAQYYKTIFVPEIAREYIDQLSRPYEENDLLRIAKSQSEKEDSLIKKANKILICDTTLLVICIWSKVKYNRIYEWIIEEEKKRKYDFYLLTDIDLPWEEDPQREHPHLRQFLFDSYKKALIKKNVKFEIVSGQGNERIKNAVACIERMLKNSSL